MRGVTSPTEFPSKLKHIVFLHFASNIHLLLLLLLLFVCLLSVNTVLSYQKGSHLLLPNSLSISISEEQVVYSQMFTLDAQVNATEELFGVLIPGGFREELLICKMSPGAKGKKEASA